MGMGHGSNIVWVIDKKDLKMLVPKEYEGFFSTLKDCGCSFEKFAEAYRFDDPDTLEFDERPDGFLATDAQDAADTALVEAAWSELRTAFEKATTTLYGAQQKDYLFLHVNFHHEDEADRYDDITGVFFTVDGMEQLSPAGETFKGIIEQKSFVTFG